MDERGTLNMMEKRKNTDVKPNNIRTNTEKYQSKDERSQ